MSDIPVPLSLLYIRRARVKSKKANKGKTNSRANALAASGQITTYAFVAQCPTKRGHEKQLYLISYSITRFVLCFSSSSVPLADDTDAKPTHSQTGRRRNVHHEHRRPHTNHRRAMIRADYYLVVCILSVAASPPTTTPVRPTRHIILSL